MKITRKKSRYAKMFILLVPLVIHFFTMPANAQQASENIRLTVLPQNMLNEQKRGESDHHYFGAQSVYIPVMMDANDAQIRELKIEVAQLGFSLKAPVTIAAEMLSPLKDKQIFSCRYLAFLKLPDVKRKTSFEMTFVAQTADEESWQNVGQAQIHVYPRTILKPLQEWSKGVQLRVRDREGNLVRFLEKNQIEFVDYRAALPKGQDLPVVTLIVGDPPERFLENLRVPFETMIILREKVETMPNIIVQPIKTGRLIDVSVPLLDDLTNAPQKQLMLVEVIRLTNTLK